MRRFLISLLLASTAIPAVASADPGDNDQPRAEREDHGDRGGGGQRARDNNSARQAQPRPEGNRERRGGMSDAAPQPQPQPQQQQQEAPRQMRMERSDRGPDPQQQPRQQQQQQVERQSHQADRQADRQIERQQRIEQPQQGGGFNRPDRAPRNGWVDRNGGSNAGQPVVHEQRNRGPRVITTDGLPNDNGSFIRRTPAERGDVGRQDRPMRGSFAERLGGEQERNLARQTRRPGLPPGTATGMFPHPGGTTSGGLQSTPLPGGGELRHSGSGSQWGTQWRGDHRYDWRDWRRHHRSSFHFGFYSDPFGFGYQRMNYGWTLFPSYYRSNYWLRDPWQYRLPPVYGPYRWVRYYDDALLVDTWSGEVVDVIYDFFW